MAWYDIDIYVGRPSSVWDTTLGTIAPGWLQSWSYDYGADTQRGTHPPRPPTFAFSVLLAGSEAEPEWLEGDRCIARFSYPGQAAFTYFVGSLEKPTFDSLTGYTIVSCRAYGLLANLPGDVSLEVHEDDGTGTLFLALLEAAGVPLASRRADSTMSRELERYLASETDLIRELQRIADTQGPPALWYQTWDGAILAHARGMLTDALTIGGQSDHQARGRISREHDLRNIVNFVSVDVIVVNVSSSTSIVTANSDSGSSDVNNTLIFARIDLVGLDYDYVEFEVQNADEVSRVVSATVAHITAYSNGVGGSVTVRARRYGITTTSTTVTNTLVEQDGDSIARFGTRQFNRDIFGGLDESDVRDLARAFLRQYANGLTQRSFDLQITPAIIAAIIGDGSDFSGLYVGRPIVIVQDDEAALGRISRVSIGASSPVLVARIETDSYESGELLFVPSSFTRNVGTGDAYSITIPAVIGGVAPYTYARQSGPGHASFDPATRIVSGNAPNNPRTQDVVIRATDSSPRRLDGALTTIGSDAWPDTALRQGIGMAIDGSTIYAVSLRFTNDLLETWTVNRSDGALTLVGNAALPNADYNGVGAIFVGGTLYVSAINRNGNQFVWSSIDTSDGSRTDLGFSTIPSLTWGVGLVEDEGTVYAGLIDDTGDIFYLYTVDISDGTLTQVGTHDITGTATYRGGGMLLLDGIVYAALVNRSSNEIEYYRVGLDDGSLAAILNNEAFSDSWNGLGFTSDASGIYMGVSDDSDDEFEFYSVSETGSLFADFTLTLEIAGSGPSPFNWRFDTLAQFETYFTIPQGSNDGHWQADNGGSTGTSNTGPSTNNAAAFIHTECSSNSGETNLEINGLAVAMDAANTALNDRDIIIRYCFQTTQSGTGRSLRFQGRDTGGAWTTIATLYAWPYAGSRDDGDTVTDRNGDDFTVALDGGWRDVTVSTGDYDEYRLAPDYDGNNIRQDIALHSIRSA